MQCKRCHINLFRINYPADKCRDGRGRPLRSAVDRCPCCLLDWTVQSTSSVDVVQPVEQPIPYIEPGPIVRQLTLF